MKFAKGKAPKGWSLWESESEIRLSYCGRVGLYTADQMRVFHDALDSALARFGVRIDAYYHCPHHPDFTGPCACRKPAPGMIEKALFDFEADSSECIMFGDKPSDEGAAQAAGVKFSYV